MGFKEGKTSDHRMDSRVALRLISLVREVPEACNWCNDVMRDAASCYLLSDGK